MRIHLTLAAALLATTANARGIHWRADPKSHPVTTANANAGIDFPQLQYYGGHVISNVKIYAIFWGGNVDGTTQGSIGPFYQAFATGPMFSWLDEYQTTIQALGGQNGTGQHIGKGSFVKAITITPGHTGTTLQDSDIQAELQSQIAAGHIPAPDANTIYMNHFPPGTSLSIQGASSCKSGGFCAYHSTIDTGGGGRIYYSVIPDFGSGSGCDLGCGTSTQFNNTCSASSHELVEAITDAEVGLATGNGPPLAWYDVQTATSNSSHGEIGDICNGQQLSFAGGDGKTYTQQAEWSNAQGSCIQAYPANNFGLAVSAEQTVTAGSSATFTITTSARSGNPGAIQLSTQDLPAAVNATFSPASVTPGQSAVLTLTTSNSSGSGTFIVVGSAGGTAVNQPATVTVTGGSGGGGGGSCPPSTINIGGICAPASCSQAGATPWVALFFLGAFALSRRRRAQA